MGKALGAMGIVDAYPWLGPTIFFLILFGVVGWRVAASIRRRRRHRNFR